MKECDGNQQLENMSATQTQKRIGDFFSVEILPNKRKRSNRVKPMVKNNQLMEKLGNRRKKKRIKPTGYKSLNFTGYVMTMQNY